MGNKNVPTDSEQALMLAVTQQPVSTAIEGHRCSFQSHPLGELIALCSQASFDVDRDVVYCQCGLQLASWVRGACRLLHHKHPSRSLYLSSVFSLVTELLCTLDHPPIAFALAQVSCKRDIASVTVASLVI